MQSSQATRRKERFSPSSASSATARNAGRSLHLLSSPSRAAGPPKEGEQSLLNSRTQEDYRALVQQKIDAFVARYPSEPSAKTRSGEQKEMAENILILFRKLREGIVASSRLDDFAIEVYESSACWSVIFNDNAQSTSILAQIPELRRRKNTHAESAGSSAPPLGTAHSMSRQESTELIHHLHLLRIHHPSQREFQTLLRAPSSERIPPTHRVFLLALATALRRNNYVALNELTDPQTNELLRGLDYKDLHAQALLISLRYLREVVRMEVWRCVHSAYRELSDKPDVQAWLARSLCLAGDAAVASWIGARVKAGEAAEKQNGGGWLMVRKAPPAATPN